MKAIKPSEVINNQEIRVLKIGNCPSLSARSTLTYHVGSNAQSEIQLRVYANTGKGFFNQEWIPLNAIQHAFEKSNKPITSSVLNSLFRGKSVNTPAFLFAVLKHEGLVMPSEGKRSYECIDPVKFMEEVNALIESTVNLKVEEKLIEKKPKPSKKAIPQEKPEKKSPMES